jgi:hypothetical protein
VHVFEAFYCAKPSALQIVEHVHHFALFIIALFVSPLFYSFSLFVVIVYLVMYFAGFFTLYHFLW